MTDLVPRHSQLLLALREVNHWTQSQLAERLGVTVRTIQRWECGDRDPPVYLLELVRIWLGINAARDNEKAPPGW